MDQLQLALLASIFLVLVVDLITVAARAGLLTANQSRVMAVSEATEPRLRRALALLNSPVYSRAGLHLAQAILRVLLVWLAFSLIWPLQEVRTNLPLVIGFLATFALLVPWIEWMVEENVSRNPERWILRLSLFTRVVVGLLYPILTLTLRLTSNIRPNMNFNNPMTEDELKSWVNAEQQEGTLEKEERKMIYSIFRLGDTLAREIMVPRIDMMALEVNTPLDQAVDTLLRSGFSRLPVYEDTIDNVLGLLYAKDLLRAFREGNEISSLRDLLRTAYFVPEAKKVDELLAEMQARRVHMAVVVDEYGGVAGLVTLEDIVEEIVGEIQDEYDQAEELPYLEVGEGEYVFLGKVDLDDFNEVMGSILPREEADTIGGFIYNRIGRVPMSGESVRVNNLLLTVEQVSARRIRKVRAQWAPLPLGGEEEKADVDR